MDIDMQDKTKGQLVEDVEALRRELAELEQEKAERRQAERRIRESEGKYRLLFETSPDAIAIIDKDGRFLAANSAMGARFGISPEDLIGKLLSEIVPENAVRKWTGIIRKALRKEQLQILDEERMGVFTHNIVVPIKIEGQEDTVQIISRNMTERMLWEKALQDSEKRYRSLFDSSLTGQYVIEIEGKIVAVNKYGAEVLGFEQPEDLIGRNITDFYKNPKDRGKIIDGIKKGGVRSFELELVKEDGSIITTLLATSLIGLGEGKVILTSGMDITQRREAEKIIKHRLKFEETIATVSTRFVGGSDIDDAINASLEDIGRLNGVSRAYVFLVNEAGTMADNTHEWCATGVSPQIDNLKNLPVEMFPWSLAELSGGKVIQIKDVSKLPRERRVLKELLESQDIKSCLIFPLFVKGQLTGIVGFDDIIEAGEWSDEDITILRIFSEVLGTAFERRQTEKALKENEDRYRDLIENANDIIYTHDFDGNFTSANVAALKSFGYTMQELSHLNVAQVVDPEYFPLVQQKIMKKLRGTIRTGPYEFLARSKDGRAIWLEVSTRRVERDGRPVEIQGIARDITERRNVEEQLEHSFVELAEVISRAVSSRDPYTAGHQERVAKLARLVGERMGLSKDRLQGIYIGSLLHDIGKLATPASILSKTGSLSDEEWALIQAHTREGCKIIDGVQFPWPIADMALHHHERIDGSGYPHGISGDELSLENRILAVCDVVEAMSSHRPYRPARSKKDVLDEIRGGRGTKYDADVVDIMLKIIEGGEFKFGWEA